MRFAYVTLDEVNLLLARRLAERAGLCLDTLTTDSELRTEKFDGFMYDFDSLPAECRGRLMHGPHATPSKPVAVHSYNLADRQSQALIHLKVVFAPNLSPDLFDRLCRRVLASQRLPKRRCIEEKGA
jgi:hypothetical protein